MKGHNTLHIYPIPHSESEGGCLDSKETSEGVCVRSIKFNYIKKLIKQMAETTSSPAYILISPCL